MSLNIKTAVTPENPTGYIRVAGNASNVTTASNVIYTNTTSELSAGTVQAAIDEIATNTVNGHKLHSNVVLGGNDITVTTEDTYQKDTTNKDITTLTTLEGAVAQLDYRTSNVESTTLDKTGSKLPTEKVVADYVDGEITVKTIKVNDTALTPGTDKDVDITITTSSEKNGVVIVNGVDKTVYTHPSVNHIPADGAAGNTLRWDSAGKAKWEAVDTTPTNNSTGLVTSGGVKTALDNKANKTTISSVESTVSVNTVPECLGYAGVKMIGGKTQKVVQLLQHGNMDGSGWSAFSESYLSVSMSNNELTATVLSSSTGYYIGATNTSGLSIPKNHVILVKADFNPSVKTSFGFDINYVRNRTECNANTYTTVYDRFEALDNYSGVVTSPTNMSTGDTYKVKNFQIFDLTAMFGSGNEPTTEQFIAMFNEAYYPYGNYLYSASVEKIVSVGKNIYPSSSSVTIPASGGNFINSTDTIKVPKGTYILSYNQSTTSGQSEVNFVSSSGSLVANKVYSNRANVSETFTLADDAEHIGAYCNAECTITNIMLRRVDTDATYSPYNETTISVPNSILSLPDYGCSAGSVYNWVDFENGVYHHNVGSVELSTLSYEYNEGGSTYYTNKLMSQIKKGVPHTEMYNAVSEKYNMVVYNEILDAVNNISVSVDGFVTAKSTSIPSGIFYYELSDDKKEVKPISAFIPPIPCEEGGTITLQNPHSLDVPNTIVYKEAK